MKYEVWLLHEKVGKQPWKQITYIHYHGKEGGKTAKAVAKQLTTQYDRRKFKAVRYVVSR